MLGWLTRLFNRHKEQLDRVEAILTKLDSKLDAIPNLTIQGIEPLLAKLKVAKTQKEVSQVIHKLAVINNTAIDNELIKILQLHGRLSIAALYRACTDKQICRRAALFRHLKILLAEGRVKKEVTAEGIFYSLPVYQSTEDIVDQSTSLRQSTDTDTKSTVYDTKSTEDTDRQG
jgi:hypothetical protein